MIVGLLGGGVIGGGWAARFLVNGADVRLYDPDPDAQRKVEEMLENARRAFARLTLAPLPEPGALVFAGSAEEAADGVDFVQESAPERIEMGQPPVRHVAGSLGESAGQPRFARSRRVWKVSRRFGSSSGGAG